MAYSTRPPLYRTMRVLRPVPALPVAAGLAPYARHAYRLDTGRDPHLAPYQARVAAHTDESAFCPTCPYCTECDISYRKTLQPGDVVPDASDDPGYLQGKVVLVDVSDGWVMPLTLDLPDDLTPASPDEVESAVWLRSSDRRVGTYSGAPAPPREPPSWGSLIS